MISETVDELADELACRIDQLKEEGHIDDHAAVCLGGIIEGMTSVRDALRRKHE